MCTQFGRIINPTRAVLIFTNIIARALVCVIPSYLSTNKQPDSRPTRLDPIGARLSSKASRLVVARRRNRRTATVANSVVHGTASTSKIAVDFEGIQ